MEKCVYESGAKIKTDVKLGLKKNRDDKTYKLQQSDNEINRFG